MAALDRSIAEIAATGFENEAQRESYVLAPEDGMVTAFQIDRGKQASPAQPLMSLIPAGTQTSHLDTGLESEISAAVSALQLTRIVIAHRPETIAASGREILMAILSTWTLRSLTRVSTTDAAQQKLESPG